MVDYILLPEPPETRGEPPLSTRISADGSISLLEFQANVRRKLDIDVNQAEVVIAVLTSLDLAYRVREDSLFIPSLLEKDLVPVHWLIHNNVVAENASPDGADCVTLQCPRHYKGIPSRREEEPAGESATQMSFTFASFSETDRSNLKFVFDADIKENAKEIELTPSNTALINAMGFCDEKGKIFYKDSIQMRAKSGPAVFSFSTCFTFLIRSENQSNTGDGLAFVLAADPYFEGDEGGQFGIFKTGPTHTATVAVEFDTFKNDNLMDIDANHVGVDIDNALSVLSASASAVNITLQDGRPITAWIDYLADLTVIEVRISDENVKPLHPLIEGSLDLSSILASKMWVGFSASTHELAH
ncbi:hypothetical protein R1flu_004040 [Riccia fluitans]|uniref:Legume lectin domain-containing protein n=1 Tax=Riccia fluitans TaxID=41844 RepID=A0ABD1YP59_9MARC